MRKTLCVLAMVATTALALACSATSTGRDAGASSAHVQDGPDLETFIRSYTTDRSSVQRFHRLPWCEESLDRTTQFTTRTRQELSLLDFAALDQHGKVDYVLLSTELAAEDSRLALERRQIAEMDAALPFRRTVLELELTRRRMEATDPQHAAAKLAEIPGQIKQTRERIAKAKDATAADALRLTPVVARRAARATSDLRNTLWAWFSYHDGFKPDFGWWARKPFNDAVGAMDDYARYLREDIAGQRGKDDDPLVGDPIGAEGLAADLASEMIVYTPQELIAIGEKEFAWCEAEMKKAAAQMGLGDDWKAALERVKQDHVPPGEQDVLVKQQSLDAIKFVQDRDLVTIPDLCMETWRIEMLSTDAQKTLPFAVYGGQHMGVAYATDQMKHDDKLMSMRGNNRHFTRIVTPHELIPGHHLQGYMAQRIRPYRGIFSTPFYVEGWALYWEMTLWDLDYPLGPEDRIGMLFWRMHRCARIIVSLKFHLGEMAPQQMVDFLVDRVGHERFGATSEVRRYIAGDYSPLYQCGYMIGGLQLRSLYRDLVPAKMTPKQFNDAVLACNSVPIEMVRAELAGTGLTREWKPTWKFGGE